MHEYTSPGYKYINRDWGITFWRIFIFAVFISVGVISMFFADARVIERTGIIMKTVKVTPINIRSRYVEQRYILDDGTQCIILRSAAIVGFTCNWKN